MRVPRPAARRGPARCGTAQGPRSTSIPSWSVTVSAGPFSFASATIPRADDAGRERDAEQREELEPVPLRDLVRAVEQVLGQEREQLEQRDAGVALVEVRPLRVVDRDARQRLVDEVLVRARVDRGAGVDISRGSEEDGQADALARLRRHELVLRWSRARPRGRRALRRRRSTRSTIRGSQVASAFAIRSSSSRRVAVVFGSNRNCPSPPPNSGSAIRSRRSVLQDRPGSTRGCSSRLPTTRRGRRLRRAAGS